MQFGLWLSNALSLLAKLKEKKNLLLRVALLLIIRHVIGTLVRANRRQFQTNNNKMNLKNTNKKIIERSPSELADF